MFSITKSFCKVITKGFPWTKQCVRKENVIDYIEMLSSLMLELLDHEKVLHKSKPIECIWKTFQVTEVEFFMWKRKSKPTFSDNNTTQRFLHQNPHVESTWHWRCQGEWFLEVYLQIASDVNHSFMALYQI